MITFSNFERNLSELRLRLSAACSAAGLSEEAVSLLPVTKNHPVDAIEYAARCGLHSVGENRVQEANEKRESYQEQMTWELIGHLQSNKAQLAVSIFDRIQSVDSLKLLRRLDRHAGEQCKRLPILLQCNSGEDPNKYGFKLEEADTAIEAALQAENLVVEGLMTIAPLDDKPDVAKSAFERLRELRDRLEEAYGVSLPELSMGMTGDLESAIAAGSTQIRVGTALYGARQY